MAKQKLSILQKALIDPKFLPRWSAARARRAGLDKPKVSK